MNMLKNNNNLKVKTTGDSNMDAGRGQGGLSRVGEKSNEANNFWLIGYEKIS